jgi:hypothetical protein
MATAASTHSVPIRSREGTITHTAFATVAELFQ